MKVSPRNRSLGLSLVELMVAMVISLILLIGVIQIFVGTSTTNRAQEGLSRVQENARFGIDSVSRDLRMAGFTGCPRSSEVDMNVLAQNVDQNSLLGGFTLRGVDDAQGATNFWATNGEPDDLVADTPAIRIYHSGDSTTSPSEMTGSNDNFQAANFWVDDNLDVQDDDIVIITDCRSAHAVAAHNEGATGDGNWRININSNNDPNNWNHVPNVNYDERSRVLAHRAYTYFIAERREGFPALYRRNEANAGGAQSIELVENLETMRIQYGRDTNGDEQVDEYVNAGALTGADDWDEIVAVRISMLVRSENLLGEERTRQFVLLGDTLPEFQDRRIRQVATTTISLRNRLN